MDAYSLSISLSAIFLYLLLYLYLSLDSSIAPDMSAKPNAYAVQEI
jgi:hypothetical protein